MTIGERIKQKRIELGLTQDELAKKLGYTSRTSIARIESGSNQLRQRKIAEFADALNTTPSFLMGWEDEQDEEEHYYLDPEAREFAEFLFHNPEYKVLFSAARDVKKEDLAFVKDLLDRFGKKG